MSSSTGTIHTTIVNRLKGITGLGRVFAYEPYNAAAQDLAAQYMVFGKIKGWAVVRESSTETPATIGTLGNFANLEKTDWKIVGFWEVTEGGASALEFQALVETLRDEFRKDRDLGIPGLSTVHAERAGLELIDTGLAQFCGAVCHSAVLGLTTEQYI